MQIQEKHLQACLHELSSAQRELMEIYTDYLAFNQALARRPRTLQDALDSIPGRRVLYNLVANLTFDAEDVQQPMAPMTFPIFQDGAFVMTHYPHVLWKPSAPAAATRLGQWRPVTTWTLADQVEPLDRVDLSYTMFSGGSQRNLQNPPFLAGPLFSRPDHVMPLTAPTLFTPNDIIQFVPFFESIVFSASGTATTAGDLRVTLLGYKIVSM